MASEWGTLPVAEAPLEIIDGDRGVNYPKQEDFEPSGDCLFLNTGNVTTTGFNFRDRSFITKEKDAVLRKGKLKRHDVVLTTRGTVGNVALFDESVHFEDVRINSGMVLLRADQSKLSPRFLFQFVRSPLFKEQVAALITGSAQPQLPIRDIRRVEIPLPPLAEQKAIASILGALDDKIELNRRMNATLEGMARALFQSWFVDFDPVRAKLDGRKPEGMDKATAALFPDAFEESSLGPVPKGWEVCSLAKKIELLSGGTPKTSEPGYWDGDIPWYSVKDSPSETDVWVVETEKCVTKLGIENSAAQILPEGTTIISARGTVGKLALIGTPMAINQSCYGVRGVKDYADYFTYYSLRQATADLQQRTHGTVFDTITRQTFETLDCIFPPAYLTQAFDRSVTSMMVKIKANSTQSRTLATLRDTLLPKLLSGELNVVSIPKVTK